MREFKAMEFIKDEKRNMKTRMTSALLAAAMVAATAYAQAPASKAGDDTWGVAPTARDDRFSNPKSALYAGPDGWFNFGEVRSTLGGVANPKYQFKGGFNLTTHTFVAVSPSPGLQVMSLDFETDTPAAGTYEVGPKASPAQKKVKVEFSDVSEKKIRNWGSSEKAGTLTVKNVNGFLYVKFRNVVLQPNGMSNADDTKAPLAIGFEGAIAPEK